MEVNFCKTPTESLRHDCFNNLIMGSGQNCTKTKLHKVTKLHEGTKFAQGHKIARRYLVHELQFCT